MTSPVFFVIDFAYNQGFETRNEYIETNFGFFIYKMRIPSLSLMGIGIGASKRTAKYRGAFNLATCIRQRFHDHVFPIVGWEKEEVIFEFDAVDGLRKYCAAYNMPKPVFRARDRSLFSGMPAALMWEVLCHVGEYRTCGAHIKYKKAMMGAASHMLRELVEKNEEIVLFEDDCRHDFEEFVAMMAHRLTDEGEDPTAVTDMAQRGFVRDLPKEVRVAAENVLKKDYSDMELKMKHLFHTLKLEFRVSEKLGKGLISYELINCPVPFTWTGTKDGPLNVFDQIIDWFKYELKDRPSAPKSNESDAEYQARRQEMIKQRRIREEMNQGDLLKQNYKNLKDEIRKNLNLNDK